jgi:diaminopimelate decarboxylase
MEGQMPAAVIAEVKDGHLVFDGADVAALADRVPTPFFLFSARQVRWNVASLRNAFARRHLDTELFYASKACSALWLLRCVHGTGINVEVNSGGELYRALQTGFRPDQIIFNGVAKTRTEVREAVSAGVRAIVADSLYELERIADVAAGVGGRAAVALRVDVDVPTQTHPGMATTHGGKAGIDLDDAVSGFRYAAAQPALDVRGLHCHIGSQITGIAPYVRAVSVALDVAEAAEEAIGRRLEFLDAGGGFAVPYRAYEPGAVCDAADYFCSTVQADDYAAAICGLLAQRRPDLRLFLEPGRAIVASAAILVARVENQKVKRVRDADGRVTGEERWLTIDAGYNTLLEHCLYDWYYPAVVANRAGEPATAPFRLAGPLCDGGDVFVGDAGDKWRHFPATTGVGDVIAFGNAGAYTIELMQPNNAQPRAGAYAIDQGELVEIRRREDYRDMIALDRGWQTKRGASAQPRGRVP